MPADSPHSPPHLIEERTANRRLDFRNQVDSAVSLWPLDSVREDGLSPLLCFLVRALVINHYVGELVDKATNWDSWVDTVGRAGFSAPVLELALAVTLLGLAVIFVLIGRDLVLAAIILALYQVPTSLFFESGWYEWSDSASAVGGVMALALLSESRKRHASTRAATSSFAAPDPISVRDTTARTSRSIAVPEASFGNTSVAGATQRGAHNSPQGADSSHPSHQEGTGAKGGPLRGASPECGDEMEAGSREQASRRAVVDNADVYIPLLT